MRSRLKNSPQTYIEKSFLLCAAVLTAIHQSFEAKRTTITTAAGASEVGRKQEGCYFGVGSKVLPPRMNCL